MMITLLLARGDWLSVVVPIVFFVIYAINQLLAARKPATPARKPQPRPPQPPPATPQTSSQSKLNDEIDQFLKRANVRRGDRPKQAAPIARPAKAPPKSLVERRLDAKPVTPREKSSVAASVEKHLSNRTFSQRADHLAEDIVRGDQQMEQHLQKAFSHRVGTLSDVQQPTGSQAPATDTETAVVVAPNSAANAIAGLLADPTTFRQMIILHEILQRPENRW